jgi:hypothetical protein
MRHEGFHTVARGREVSADGNHVVRRVPKRTRDHADGPILVADRQHGFRSVLIEGLM